MNQRSVPYGVPLDHYQRLETRVVDIGGVPLGGEYPIRIQSMTTTDTMDTTATVRQTLELIEAGCDYVRITAPSIRDAENLGEIQQQVRAAGFQTPLIADIHFTPNAAEAAARLIAKVRVNPGNYADRKKFQQIEYSDADYAAELERIRERFTPLVRICREEGTAMRIGTNHGSLSDRIMSRYGDTPLGMVESALEFVRICRDENYHQLVLSMKASNPQVMVQAYRLLIQHMLEEDMNYPLHLGVTEAGDGEDGRIKSASGIGSLLEDGIGDTIRVSLTEDPVHEVPVAQALVARVAARHDPVPPHFPASLSFDPFQYQRRKTDAVLQMGDNNVPIVVGQPALKVPQAPEDLVSFGYQYQPGMDKWTLKDMACDLYHAGQELPATPLPPSVRVLLDGDFWLSLDPPPDHSYPLFDCESFCHAERHSRRANFVVITPDQLWNDALCCDLDDPTVVLVLDPGSEPGIRSRLRTAFLRLQELDLFCPLIMRLNYGECTLDNLRLWAATDAGALYLDGFGDGLWIQAPHLPVEAVVSLQFGILQAARTRITKTEYIACPSCGRTLFDLQETTELIRSRTAHLKGVKIGIMGCIVNGPGEMADADYGYVGSGPGKITLYRGQEVVKSQLPSAVAVDELIELIKSDGRWLDPN